MVSKRVGMEGPKKREGRRTITAPSRTKKEAACSAASPVSFRLRLEVHPAARGHAATAAARALLLRHFGDHRLGGDEQARNRRSALQRLTHDLGRIDNALGEHVHILTVL